MHLLSTLHSKANTFYKFTEITPFGSAFRCINRFEQHGLYLRRGIHLSELTSMNGTRRTVLSHKELWYEHWSTMACMKWMLVWYTSNCLMIHAALSDEVNLYLRRGRHLSDLTSTIWVHVIRPNEILKKLKMSCWRTLTLYSRAVLKGQGC